MKRYTFCQILILLILSFVCSRAAGAEEAPVVVISSYNPDVTMVKDIISAFNETYAQRKCDRNVVLESMNCLNLSESPKWKKRMEGILGKYIHNGKQPAVIVLLGSEASSAYLSIEDEAVKRTPVIVGMRSDCIVPLPENDSVNLKTWQPEVRYLTKDYSDYNIVGGCIYSYDIGKNIRILEKLLPETDSLIFLSDNTMGGITLQAHFRACIKQYPRYNVEYLDGRSLNLLEVNDRLSKVPPHKALVIGTWRIDSSDNYTMSNTTYTLAQSTTGIPAITISNVGKGHWVLGGYGPAYSNSGSKLADCVADYLETGKKSSIFINKNGYFFDNQKVQQLHVKLDTFDQPYELINKQVGFIEAHLGAILLVAFIVGILSFSLIFCLVYIRRNRSLNAMLQHKTEELKSNGEELEKALEMANQTNKMKSQFIANMSHEIRTPLNAVVGFSNILTSTDIELSDQEKKDISDRIIFNSDLLLKLINDILELSRLDAGRSKYEISPVEFVGLMTMAADSAKVNLTNEVEIRSESNVAELNILTDPARMTQVFSNLLSNAKKCTERGTITARLDYDAENAEMTVSVTDTGCGIPEDKIETVFQRFEKLDEFRQGTGLGLAITRAIIEQLGGRIWVDPTYKDGARFVFKMPVTLSERNN